VKYLEEAYSGIRKLQRVLAKVLMQSVCEVGAKAGDRSASPRPVEVPISNFKHPRYSTITPEYSENECRRIVSGLS